MKDNLSSTVILLAIITIVLLFVNALVVEYNKQEIEYMKQGYDQCVISGHVVWSKKCP